jgi:hypothetical protein
MSERIRSIYDGASLCECPKCGYRDGQYLAEDWINHQDEHPIEIEIDVPYGIYRLKEGEV